MPSKIAVIGKLQSDTVEIKAKLIETKKYEVDLNSNVKSVLKTLESDEIDLVIFHMEELDSKYLPTFENIRKRQIETPILIIAKRVTANLYEGLEKIPLIALLTYPYRDRDLLYLVDQLVQKQNVSSVHYQRYATNEDVKVRCGPKGKFELSAKMLNVSRGGALLKYSGAHLSIGDAIQVSLGLDQLPKKYDFKAKVVWTMNSRKTVASWWAGVKFEIDEERMQGLDGYLSRIEKESDPS